MSVSLPSENSPNSSGLRVNKAELARLFGVSEPTVGKWLVEGCPVAEEGSNGVAYQFDPDAVKAWRDGQATRKRELEEERTRQLAEKQAELFGDGTAFAPEGLTQDEIKTYLENLRLFEDLKRKRGEVVTKADVRNEFQAVFQVARQHLLGFATTLARTAGLTPEQQQAAEALGRQTLGAMHRQIRDPGLKPELEHAPV